MATKRGRRPKILKKTKEIKETSFLNRPERKRAAIGIAVVGIVLLLTAWISANKTQKTPSTTPTPTPIISGPSAIPSTTITASTATPTQPPKITVTPSVKPTITQPTPTAKISRLPTTDGEPAVYTVRKGDSLAKIGFVFCNDKTAWIRIAAQNNIVSPYTIHPESTLTVSCN